MPKLASLLLLAATLSACSSLKVVQEYPGQRSFSEPSPAAAAPQTPPAPPKAKAHAAPASGGGEICVGAWCQCDSY